MSSSPPVFWHFFVYFSASAFKSSHLVAWNKCNYFPFMIATNRHNRLDTKNIFCNDWNSGIFFHYKWQNWEPRQEERTLATTRKTTGSLERLRVVKIFLLSIILNLVVCWTRTIRLFHRLGEAAGWQKNCALLYLNLQKQRNSS